MREIFEVTMSECEHAKRIESMKHFYNFRFNNEYALREEIEKLFESLEEA